MIITYNPNLRLPEQVTIIKVMEVKIESGSIWIVYISLGVRRVSFMF